MDVEPLCLQKSVTYAGWFRRRVIRQYSALTAGDIISAAASFLGLIFVARLVPIATFGKIAFAQAVATALFLILDPRLEDAVVRYVPLVARSVGSGGATRLFHLAMLWDACIGCLSAGVVVALLQSGAVPLGEAANDKFITLAVLQAGLQASQGTVAAGFSVTEGLAQWGIIRIVIALLTTCASVVGLLVGGADWYLGMLVVSAAASTAAVVALSVRRVQRVFGRTAALPDGTIGSFWRFAGVASMAASVLAGTEALPMTVVGAVGGPAALARFRVGLAPARLTMTVFSAVPSMLFPVLSREAAERRFTSISKRVMAWTRLALPVVAVLCALSWVALPKVVPFVYGERFEAAVGPARFLVLAALIRSLTAWSKVLSLSVGRPGVRLWVTAIDAVLLVGGTWVLATRGTLTDVAVYHLVVAVLVSLIWVRVATSPKRSRPKSSSNLLPVGARGYPAEEDLLGP